MIIPLDLLVTNTGNMYKLTAAMIKRAEQINLTGDPELEEINQKVVSLAIKQVLTKKIEYRLEES